jgi:hypothetical protein
MTFCIDLKFGFALPMKLRSFLAVVGMRRDFVRGLQKTYAVLFAEALF